MNRICPALAVLVALTAMPGAASAATLTKTGTTIAYSADAQEANNVTISLAGDVYTVTEQGNSPGRDGIAVNTGGGCQVTSQGATTTATCPAANTKLLDVETGDQNDTVKVLAPTAARILGGEGADNIAGGDGSDYLDGGPGADTMTGGGSNFDILDYSGRVNPVTVTLDGQPGDGEQGEGDNAGADIEVVNGGAGNDTITGSNADNVLNGNGGDDTLNGRGGSDALNRGDGDENRDAGAGSDVLNGGDGTDGVSYADARSSVRVSLDGLPGDGAAGENDNVGRDVESITGGRFADALIGNSGPNVLQGGRGNDRLLGGGGEDTLDGGVGNDAIQVRDGAEDRVLCGPGKDGAIVDKRDVSSACEVVERTVVQVLTSKAKVRNGAVTAGLRCSAYTTEGCRVALTLKLKRTTLGKKTFSLRSAGTAFVRVKLSRPARKLLRRRHRAIATMTVLVTDPSGQATKTTARLRLTA